MVRKIVHIDEEKCNGCGACAKACHEGAIAMIGHKARLIKDDYCDGLGDCLPACPMNAIEIIEREAKAYDEEAVRERMQQKSRQAAPVHMCPGTMARMLQDPQAGADRQQETEVISARAAVQSQLMQWPVQIKLVPMEAPYFENAKLLVAADCTAYAYANMHEEFIKGHVTLIGCPKLDEGDYAEKLTEIIKRNKIKSITVVRMEVPCCGGLENAVIRALQQSQKMIPWQVITITCDGKIREE